MKKLLVAALLALCAPLVIAQSFVPLKNVTPVAVTASAQTVTLPVITNPGPFWKYYVSNWGSPLSNCTNPILFTMDGTTASTSNGMVLGPNTGVLVTLPAALTTVSVISAGTGCTFYITVGVAVQ